MLGDDIAAVIPDIAMTREEAARLNEQHTRSPINMPKENDGRDIVYTRTGTVYEWVIQKLLKGGGRARGLTWHVLSARQGSWLLQRFACAHVQLEQWSAC